MMSPESRYRLIRSALARALAELQHVSGLIGALNPAVPDDAALFKELRRLQVDVGALVKPIDKRLERMALREEGYTPEGGMAPEPFSVAAEVRRTLEELREQRDSGSSSEVLRKAIALLETAVEAKP